MKLTDNSYIKKFLKGAIVLFLFLNINSFGTAQKYTLKILSKNSEIPDFIRKKTEHKTFSDSSVVFSFLESLKSELTSKGYITASVDSVIFDNRFIKIYFFIGKKYRVNVFKISNLYASIKRKYNIPDSVVSEKNFINPADLPVLYDAVIREYENVGFPFAALIPEKFNLTDSEINLKLRLQKNELIRFNKIIIKGDADISDVFISRYLSVFEGDVYNEEIVSSISSKLSVLSFLTEIRPPEVDFYDNNADIYLYLKTKKANLFNGIIGFIPDKNNENKLSFTGNLDLNLLNNFGKGENIFLNWSRSAKLSQKLNVGFRIPYVFKSPFQIYSQFNLDKRDTSFMKISGKFGIDYSFKNNDKILVFVQKKQSLLLSSQNLDTSIYKNTEVLLFGLSYRSIKLDYLFNPQKGYVLETGFAGGNRTVSDEKNPYYETNILAEYYVSIYKKFVLKLASDSKYAFPDEDFYENELFDLGGFNSLRGFDENRFRTSAYSIFTVEPRYLYERNSNVFMFFNIAGIKDNKIKNTYFFPYGFGIGTNLSTKAGIFSVSYALGNMPGNFMQFSDSKIHIGYVNRF